MRNWVLPEYIEDVLPAEAERTEALRRVLLDHFRAHGYRLIQPPLIEHLDSLLTGTGQRPRAADVQGRRSAVGPDARRARRHDAAGRADRCASAERGRRHAALLRGQRAARGARRQREDARSHADRRRALRRARHRRRCRSAGPHPLRARGRGQCAGCISTSATSASIARSRPARASAATREDTELFAALRAKDVPAVAELTAKLPAAWRDALMALPTLYGPAKEVLAAARARLPGHAGDPQRARGARGAGAIGRAARRGAAHRSGRPHRLSLPQRCDLFGVHGRRTRTRSDAAAVTTASARRSGARARRPVSRWTCGSSRASSFANRGLR